MFFRKLCMPRVIIHDLKMKISGMRWKVQGTLECAWDLHFTRAEVSLLHAQNRGQNTCLPDKEILHMHGGGGWRRI